MDYLVAGKKIIEDISLFAGFCDKYGYDEEKIQA